MKFFRWGCLIFIVLIYTNLYSQETKRIRYGGDSDFYPFEYLDKNGKPAGYNIDILRAIEKETKIKIDIRLDEWDKIYEDIKVKGKYDLATIYYCNERAEIFEFSKLRAIMYDEVYIRKEESDITNLVDVIGKEIIVEKGGYAEDYLKGYIVYPKIIEADSEPEALRLLSSGVGDVAFVNYIVGVTNVERLNLTNIYSLGTPVLPREYGFAVLKKNKHILDIIESGLQIIKANGIYNAIHKKWLIPNTVERERNRRNMIYAVVAIAFLAILLMSVYLWNVSLKHSVKKKTIRLHIELNEKKKLYDELLKAKIETENLSKIKSEFLALVSHEIRTPVNVINGNTEILEDVFAKVNDPEIMLCTNTIRFELKRLTRTIDLIINVSEMHTGTYKIGTQLFNIETKVINPILHELAYEAELKKLLLKKEILTDDLILKADEYSVMQIFINLIDNAIKYTNEGEVKTRIYRNDNSQMTVEIIDTGEGISIDFLPSLFQLFSQEDHGQSRRFEGNGLGLALVKECCKINNAKIDVHSEKNKGSIFKITFQQDENGNNT